MKPVLTITICVLLGLLAGAGKSAYELSLPSTAEDFSIVSEEDAYKYEKNIETLPADVPQPKVEVDETVYYFGDMEAGATQSHKFTFRNVGQGPLKLTLLGVSCQCTVGDVPEGEILPGESVDVTVSWTPKNFENEFRQTANIGTTDPAMRRVTLTVHGQVTHQFELEPLELVLGQFSQGESHEAEVRIWLLNDHTPNILGHQFTLLDTAKYFEFRVEDVDPSRLAERDAKSGRRLIVTALPGMPPGPFEQEVVVQTDIPQHEQLTIPIYGEVVLKTDILILGTFGVDWNAQIRLLNLGQVKSAEGFQTTLNLRPDTKVESEPRIEVKSVWPESLQATLGEPQATRSGALQIPLVIAVPPGQEEAVHVSEPQGGLGKIVLGTNLPNDREIPIYVQFYIEE